MKHALIIAVVLCALCACRKENVNPFDQLVHGSPNPPVENLPQDNFAWLHQRIFRPTCAVSGCHDGSFEPEFRSIGSAYNSLVYAPVVANTPDEAFTFRVLPGDVNGSFLHERLTTFVPGTSGMMPIDLLPDSDWPENHDAYITAISSWIASGAPDMFGSPATQGNREPQVTGMLAFPSGTASTPYPRAVGADVEPIEVPATSIDVWFAFSDDSTASSALSHNQCKLATSLSGFATVPEQPLSTGATITGPDFTNINATFTHKAALTLGAYASGTALYIRVYVNDGDHTDNTEIPTDGTGEPMRDYFTMMIVP